MEIAPLPDHEKQRLAALCSYQILDTQTEKEFDDLVHLAADICSDTQIALKSLIDPHRQWFKASVGLGAKETSRDIAFCSHAILQRDILEVEDTFLDRRFYDNPLVLDAPNIRFYAGAQLVTTEGYKLGTLCTISDKPKKLSDRQRQALTTLASEVVSRMELHKQIKQMQFKHEELQDSNYLLVAINQLHKLLIQQLPVQRAAATQELLSQILSTVLGLASSQHGFVGHIVLTERLKEEQKKEGKQQPLLKIHTPSNNVWDAHRQTFIADGEGVELEFIHFNSLITEVLENHHFVASQGKVSEGHQALHHFAVLPLSISEQLVAIVGVANREGGLNVQLFQKIQPFLTTCAQLLRLDTN